MKVWSNGLKLMVLLPTAAVAIAGLWGYWEWDSMPSRALVAGRTQTLDHTIGAILQTRTKPTKYLLFSPDEIKTVLEGAELRFRGSARVLSVQLTADSGRVKWRNGKYDNHDVPGLNVHVQATLSGDASASTVTDTLVLRLPGLSALGTRIEDDPRISYNGNTPRWGDSVVMQRYTYYADDAAVEKARTPYLAFAMAMGLVVLGIVVRAVIWTRS